MIKEKVSPTILIRLTALKCKSSRVIQTKSGVHHALNKRFILILVVVVAQYVYMTTSSRMEISILVKFLSLTTPPMGVTFVQLG